MRYALLYYLTPEEFEARTDPERKEAFWAAFIPYERALRAAGVVVGGAGLEPPDTGAVLRHSRGERHVQDGPFAATKEQLGGFYLIEVPDLETALDWAARYPAGPGGGVEVRPCLAEEG